MKGIVRHLLISSVVSLALCAGASAQTQAPSNPAWTTPIAPFKITDNIYYVGSQDLASYLIATPAGDILINSNLTSSPPQILESIGKLGFKPNDVKILLISHAHFDHNAGSAELIKATGAKYMVMDGDVNNVQSGGATDFAYSMFRYPAVQVDRVLHDGDEVRLGGVTLTAHKTAGHTQGCTTWTLRSPMNGAMKDVIIVGSWNVNAEFRLVDRPGSPASYPGIVQDYQHTFAVLKSLKCDVFLGAHGEYFHMLEKLEKAKAGAGETAWIDPQGYKATVEERQRAFETEWKRQATSTTN